MAFYLRGNKADKGVAEELSKRVLTEAIYIDGMNNSDWALAQVQAIAKCLIKPKDLETLLRACVEMKEQTPCCLASTKKQFGSNIYLYSLKLFRFHFARDTMKFVYSKHCMYPPGGRKPSEVCINPWHYDLPRPLNPIPPVRINIEDVRQLPVPQRIMDHCFQNLGEQRDIGPACTFIQADELAEFCNNTVAGIPPKQSATDLFIPDTTAETRNQYLTECPESLSPSSIDRTSPDNLDSPNSFLTNDSDPEQMEDDDPMTSPQTTNGQFVDLQSGRLEDALKPEFRAGLIPRKVKTDVEFSNVFDWISVYYYERKKRIGEPINCHSPYVLIDGYSNPYKSIPPSPTSTSQRISLGYSTTQSRDSATSRALLLVGRGIRLYNLGGEVFIECLSGSPIFVQSPNCNQRHGWHAASVVQVPSGCNLKIFSYAELSTQLTECVKYGFDAVYALSRLCTIRVSFVKGWGCIFRRQQVTSAPCWIEFHLKEAMDWIDQVLIRMGCPSRVCTSYS